MHIHFRYRYRWVRFRFEERGGRSCGVFRQRRNICDRRQVNRTGRLSLTVAFRLPVLKISWKCETPVGAHPQSVAILVIVIIVVHSYDDRCNYLDLWIMSGNGQSHLYYYYYYCIRIEVAFACLMLRKKRRHRSNIKFYHIPYRIAHEKIIAPPIFAACSSVSATLRNKVLIYRMDVRNSRRIP